MREYQKRRAEHINAYHRQRHAEKVATDPEYVAMKRRAARDSRRKRKYRITRAEYCDLLTQQKGRCKICNVHYGEELRVDHNHETGEVRALLCNNCNTGLGLFKEDPDRMKSAIEYLHRYGKIER